mmetsp:Transcript_3747/g.9130  ORF Transcript_3747/g.9130 Transcript_3747/m.9130 type:complete len:289 (+) Transcript_3747:29-895(+)
MELNDVAESGWVLLESCDSLNYPGLPLTAVPHDEETGGTLLVDELANEMDLTVDDFELISEPSPSRSSSALRAAPSPSRRLTTEIKPPLNEALPSLRRDIPFYDSNSTIATTTANEPSQKSQEAQQPQSPGQCVSPAQCTSRPQPLASQSMPELDDQPQSQSQTSCAPTEIDSPDSTESIAPPAQKTSREASLSPSRARRLRLNGCLWRRAVSSLARVRRCYTCKPFPRPQCCREMQAQQRAAAIAQSRTPAAIPQRSQARPISRAAQRRLNKQQTARRSYCSANRWQ